MLRSGIRMILSCHDSVGFGFGSAALCSFVAESFLRASHSIRAFSVIRGKKSRIPKLFHALSPMGSLKAL